MSQTLVIRTPEEVSTTSRAFPKQGMFNLKITKNVTYDTVEIWFRCGASNITLELAGASFHLTAQVDAPRTVPLTPTVISGSTSLALTPGVTQYMKIKLNNGTSTAYLRCSYAAKSISTLVVGGNISGQAYVDYGKKPYISTSLYSMFSTHPVRTDITKWDISSVTDLRLMFSGNTTFNQPIGNWDVSNVTSMRRMFYGATTFNQDLSNWNISNVTDMGWMFREATTFNQPIGNWDVSKVNNTGFTFFMASAFNQDLSNWDVSNVTVMDSMFGEALAFNKNLSSWDVSKVADMSDMFRRALAFNQDLSSWNVSNVTSMRRMFYGAESFNQNLSNWNISNVTDMSEMFLAATSFNQDLSNWAAKFHVNVNLNNFFFRVVWGTSNYDKFLNALWTDINTTRPQTWAIRTVPKLLGMGSSKYSAASAVARNSLVSNGWTITDGGLVE